jgi:hypothetical protein
VAHGGESPPAAFVPWTPEAQVADASELERQTRSGPAYQRLQRDFLADENEGAWDAEAAQSQTQGVVHADARAVTHSLSAGAGCGSFQGSLLAVYARVGERMSSTPVRAGLFGPRALAVFDLNGDGIPELLVRESTGDQVLLSVKRGAYQVALERRAPNYDCDC